MNKYKCIFLFAFFIIFTPLCNVDAYTGSVTISSSGCADVGTWDSASTTCVLTDDIYGPVTIGANSITLDGNGHTIERYGSERTGINASGLSGIVIKNVNIKSFTSAIVFNNVSYSTIKNVHITNTGSYGLFIQNGQQNQLLDSIISTGYIGVFTNSGNHTISGNTFSGLSYGVKLYYQEASAISFKNNTFYNNNYGIYSQYSKNNTIQDNTFKNNTGNAYYEVTNLSSTGTVIIQNNFIDNGLQYNQGQTNYWVYSVFSQDLPVGGNYWSDFDSSSEGCDDTDSNGICDSSRTVNNFNADSLPWVSENGWKVKPEPANFYAEIKNNTSMATMRENASLSDEPIKTLPNGWIVYIESKIGANGTTVVSDGYTWWKVSDPTDGSVGWIPAKATDGGVYLSYEKEKQNEFEQKSKTVIAQQNDRANLVIDAVTHYFSNTDTNKSLYSSNDHSLKISNLVQKGFSKELILAIIAQEIGGEGFDNENVSFDYGHGITQVTMHAKSDYTKNSIDPRGILSDIRLSKCRNILRKNDGSVEGLDDYQKCYNSVYNSAGRLYKQEYSFYDDVTTNPKYKQYANTIQSIYANIKDGLGVLETKNGKTWKRDCTDNWSAGGYTFTCSDINIIKSVLGYNGAVLDTNINYLKAVSNKLKNLSNYYPNVSYGNSDNLIEKLAYANNHRIELKAHSPIEIRVKDNDGNVTGLVSGEPDDSVPYSVYDKENEKAIVFFPNSNYQYEVIGDSTITNGGEYGLDINIWKNTDEPLSFNAVAIPIKTNERHIYSVDESVLGAGGNGVTVDIDTEGDGIIDRTLSMGATFTEIKPAYIFGGFDSPLKDDSEFKSNRTLPIKFSLKDARGDTLHNVSGKIVILNSSSSRVLSGNFNEDGNSGKYQYNVSMKDIGMGNFTIEVRPDDGSIFRKVIKIVK